MRNSLKISNGVRRSCFIYIFLILIIFINLFPLWVIFKQAITSEKESLSWPPTFLPHSIDLENLYLFFKTSEIVKGFCLSIFISVTVAFLSIVIGGLSGWAMARSTGLAVKASIFLIIARMFPIIAIAIPLAVIFIKAGLYNHPLGLGLILAHCIFVLPFAALILYSTFRSIPVDLEEQAQMDGCSALGAFLKITLPLSRAGLTSAFIISFILSWNEFGYSLLLQITNRNLPPLLYYYSSFGSIGISSAISLIMMIPALCILLFFQRHISSVYIGSSIK